MPVLEVKDSDIGGNDEFRRIAEALQADARPEQVTAGWRIWDRNKDSGVSLEAGLLEMDGAELPVIGVRYDGKVAQYLTGKSCGNLLTKVASPGDHYTPGPPVTITEG